MKWVKVLHKGWRGFTLIELMVAVAIMGIISLGASMCIGQLLNQTSRDSNFSLASQQATNAVYWISHDALMAQTIVGWQNFPDSGGLCLSWTDWDNVQYSANYTVSGGVLTRTYSAGGSTASTFIAQNISAAAGKTFCTSSNGTLSFTVTTSVGMGSHLMEVAKTGAIACRPGL